jgi:hypothetical protein
MHTNQCVPHGVTALKIVFCAIEWPQAIPSGWDVLRLIIIIIIIIIIMLRTTTRSLRGAALSIDQLSLITVCQSSSRCSILELLTSSMEHTNRIQRVSYDDRLLQGQNTLLQQAQAVLYPCIVCPEDAAVQLPLATQQLSSHHNACKHLQATCCSESLQARQSHPRPATAT